MAQSGPASLATRSRFAPDTLPEQPTPGGRKREPLSTSWQPPDDEAIFPELTPLLRTAFLTSSPKQDDRQQQVDMYLLEQQQKQHNEERRRALEQLVHLTLWQQGNQRELARQGAPALAVQLLRALTEPPSQPGAGSRTVSRADSSSPQQQQQQQQQQQKFASLSEVNLAATLSTLTLLLNLCGNEDLTAAVVAQLAPVSGVAMLARLASHPQRSVGVLAVRVLINLTHSSPEGRAAAAKAGMLQVAYRMFLTKEADHAQCKLGCWLLANLCRGLEDSGPYRKGILAEPAVTKRMVALVQDYTHTPVSVLVLACRLVTGLAHEGAEAQTTLSELGAVDAVAQLVEATGLSAEVYATAVPALSALALDHAGVTSALMQRRKHLVPALGLLLEPRCDALAAGAGSNEDARVVLAVHTLVHVLGHMAANGGQGLGGLSTAPAAKGDSGAGSGVGAARVGSHTVMQVVEHGDGDLIEGMSKLSLAATSAASLAARPGQLQPGTGAAAAAAAAASATVKLKASSASTPVVYLSLGAAAKAAGVCLPLSTAVAGKHGEPALSAEQTAEIRHRASNMLLPKLRSANATVAASAAACLYYLLVATPGSAAAKETRTLLADSSLLRQLLAALASHDAELVQASLAVLDVLCSEPATAHAFHAVEPWLPAISRLLYHVDALVRRWAERVLCAAYHTQMSPSMA